MKKLTVLAILATASLSLSACGEKVVDEASNAEMLATNTMDALANEQLEAAPLDMNTTMAPATEAADPATLAADAAKDAASAAAEAAANQM